MKSKSQYETVVDAGRFRLFRRLSGGEISARHIRTNGTRRFRRMGQLFGELREERPVEIPGRQKLRKVFRVHDVMIALNPASDDSPASFAVSRFQIGNMPSMPTFRRLSSRYFFQGLPRNRSPNATVKTSRRSLYRSSMSFICFRILRSWRFELCRLFRAAGRLIQPVFRASAFLTPCMLILS